METTASPFDLNRAVGQWRASLNDSPAFRRENLDELETHLRDSIVNLGQRGLAEDEAFLIATRRVGSGPVLGKEFGKINSNTVWLNNALWILIGMQAFGFVSYLDAIITNSLNALFSTRTLPIHGGNIPLLPLWISSSPTVAGWYYGLIHLLAFASALTVIWRLLKGLSTWLGKAKNSFVGPAIFAVGYLALVLLLPAGTEVMSHIFYQPIHSVWLDSTVSSGINHGRLAASYIESIAIVALTLWLARRQMLAKTLA